MDEGMDGWMSESLVNGGENGAEAQQINHIYPRIYNRLWEKKKNLNFSFYFI